MSSIVQRHLAFAAPSSPYHPPTLYRVFIHFYLTGLLSLSRLSELEVVEKQCVNCEYYLLFFVTAPTPPVTRHNTVFLETF